MTNIVNIKHRMPDERQSVTHKFRVGAVEGYIIVGLYPDGTPGEVFLTVQKQGTLERGLSDALGIMISLALQHSVPLVNIVSKLERLRFEPSGQTKNPNIPLAASIVDYIARWLRGRFLDESKIV